MKRLNIVVLLALILALLAGIFVPQVAMAQTTIDGTIDVNTLYPNNGRISFHGADLHWVVYLDSDGYLKYTSSDDDGATWAVATNITNLISPDEPSISLATQGSDSGSYVHLTWWYHLSPVGIKYCRGTFYDDGTISFGSVYLAVPSSPTATAGRLNNIAVDSNGEVWIGYGQSGAGASGAYITKSSTNDGTWVTQDDFPVILDSQTDVAGQGFCTPIPLTSGKLVAIFSTGQTNYASERVYARRWDGSNWGAIVASTINNFNYYASAVGEDDYAHVITLERGTYDIEYTEYSYSTNTFGDYTTIYGNATSTSAPVITRDTTNNDLWVWWENDPVDDHMYMAVYKVVEATWYSYYDLIDEVDDLPANGYYLNSHYTCPRDNIGLFYIAGTAILKFKSINEQFDVDTLEPTGVTETQATLRGEIVSIGWGAPLERGIYWNVTPSLVDAEQWIDDTAPPYSVGVFTHTVGNLTQGQTYYCIAYAVNAETAWGEWVQVTAGSTGGWAVLTLEPSPINDFDATLRAQITKLAGTYATVKGFEWGHTATATWSWEDTGNFTVGLFIHTVELEADNIYYVRAYAGNETVVDYGDWIGFITKVPSYVFDDYTEMLTAPVPTTAPGGWIRPDKTYDGFPILSPIINAFADMGFGRSFFWFNVEVAIIILLTIIGAAFTKNLPITFAGLLVLFLLPFIAFEYLDWWMLAPYLLVGAALMIKEGQFSWS